LTLTAASASFSFNHGFTFTMTAFVDSTQLAALEARVTALERKRFQCPPNVEAVDESMRRARLHVETASKPCCSAAWKFVPEPYYTWELPQRAVALGAPSIYQLCKSLLMDNRKVPADQPHDPTNPKFVLVILQYAATMDNQKLVNAVRALRPVQNRLDGSQFDFRIASEQDNSTLTGYEHNSVTPFGLLQQEQVTIILSAAVAELGFFWMGGGHVHLKLGMAVTDFVRALNPIVASISHPRASGDDAESAMRKGTTEADKDLQKIMDRRREQTDSGQVSPAFKVKRQVEGTAKLSEDLQGIMEKRRQKTEEKGGAVEIGSTSPNKEALKTVELSSDLKDIMARRRQMAGSED
jgi:prolyl-tRNA editing enzyme YbaK/EbsC (Cys-tRNA(Pro) deacylase)